jgi:hypothetical protein
MPGISRSAASTSCFSPSSWKLFVPCWAAIAELVVFLLTSSWLTGGRRGLLSHRNACTRSCSIVPSSTYVDRVAPLTSWFSERSVKASPSVEAARKPHSATSAISGTRSRPTSVLPIDRVRAGPALAC